ncbi:MAG: type III polyketide synthase, partial [Pseudomonadota bacterium]
MSQTTAERAYLNHIATAVPDYDIHEKFIRFAPRLMSDEKSSRMILPISRRLQIDHRYSVLQSHANDEWLDRDGFYNPAKMPGTEERMRFYQDKAFSLAQKALNQLDLNGVTHVLITSCTGFYAPGLDSEIIQHYGLHASVERTMIGFMGCYAAINALRLARHTVRSEPEAKCLILNLELCTLHLQHCKTIDDVIPFLLFA